MKLQYSEFENNLRMIKLDGRLDIIGTNAVDVKFAGYCSGENVRVVIDLSGVEYIASIGIRLLTSNAKSLASRGGKMVLLSLNEEVRSVLEITGILGVIPAFDDLESARAALSA